MHWRGLGSGIFLIVFLLLVFLQGASAYNVSQISIDPPGKLIPGTPVVVSGIIDLPLSATESFEAGHALQVSTDLDNPRWTYAIIVDDIENRRPQVGGSIFAFTGFELSWEKASVSSRFNPDGKTPNVNQRLNKTLIRIQEVDEKGNVVDDSRFEYPVSILYLQDVSCCIVPTEEKLRRFRSHITETAARGVNTSLAEVKLKEAQHSRDAASRQPPKQFVESLKQLGAAQNSISEGENLLDKAWAEKSVADAQIPLGQADQIISWYKGNMSTANDVKLPAIITQREQAAAILSSANDEIANGNYAQAQSKAAVAYQIAHESYNAALKRKDSLIFSCWGCSSFSLTQFVISGAGIGTIVLIIMGGIIWWKRR